MNWLLIFKYLGLLSNLATALEAIESEILAGQVVQSPPISTYIDGKHVAITLDISPVS